MIRYVSAALVLGLVACSYSEEKYEADLYDAMCAKFDECGVIDLFGGSVDACNSQLTSSAEDDTSTCENYDSEAAKSCVAAVKALTCDSSLDDVPYCSSVCSNSAPETGSDTDS
jgi:hypothetical protein